MNLKLISQKQDYKDQLPKYKELEKIVDRMLREELVTADIKVMQLPHRIKTWNSIESKMVTKADKYSRVTELTDILGFRVICYFSSQVDEAADVIARIFDVDKKRSSDKRILISPTTFGYISLHNICSLKKGGDYPEELTSLKFEIQLRSILQHAWAEIEHDLGYKTALEIPRDLRREFSRIAGLLEVADEAFDNIKIKLSKYEKETIERIRADRADQMTLDRHTLNAFMQFSSSVNRLYNELAVITGGKVLTIGAEDYLPMLSRLDIDTLGDLHDALEDEHDHILMFVRRALKYSDLEEITSNSVLFYLSRAILVWGSYSEKEINDIYFTMSGDQEKADKDTGVILSLRKELKKQTES